MASSRTSHKIATYVFFDTETTGLLRAKHKPTITEMCFLAIHRKDLLAKEEPRVVNKLLLCLDPQQSITEEASSLSGLSNDMLRNQEQFDENTVKLVSNFLGHLASPVYLIAHNGNRFDYPLLRSELLAVENHLLDSVLCADSIKYFKQTTESTMKKGSSLQKPSYKLDQIYERLFDEEPPASHDAESDCVTLMKAVKVHSEEFISWVDDNAVPLSTIKPMY